MKKLLSVLLIALLMAGCGGPDLDDPATLDKIIAEAIDSEKLQERGKKGEELVYAPNQQTPYTGWGKIMNANGSIKELYQLKDGKMDLLASWYKNGQKRSEIAYKDRKVWTAVVWKSDGEKCPVTNVVDGNGVWVFYYDDGTSFSVTYKDGLDGSEGED